MKLTCIKGMFAHWGAILHEGQEYEGVVEYKSTEVITDYDNYWKYTEMVASSRDWIKKGYDESNLHEVIPDYRAYHEIHNIYAKKIDLPFITIRCSDNQKNSFCLLSDNELYELGVAKGKDGKSKDEPCFVCSVNLVDEYFDYTPIRRDNILSQLGI